MTYRDFKQMPVWGKAFNLLLRIYTLTKAFPDEEKFGIISNMRRSANSAVHNIAEGYGRFEKRDKTRFYKISRGSCYELLSQTLVASELKYITNDSHKIEIENGYQEIIQELDALIKTIETRK